MPPASDDVVVHRTELALYLYPTVSRDAAAYALYEDPATALPHAAELHALPRAEHDARRARQRAELASGESAFLDVVDPRTGELVGLSGFRVFAPAAGEAEWGCIIAAAHRRRGLADDALRVCAEVVATGAHAARGVFRLAARTREANAPMRALLARRGFELASRDADGAGGAWLRYSASAAAVLQTYPGAARADPSAPSTHIGGDCA